MSEGEGEGEGEGTAQRGWVRCRDCGAPFATDSPDAYHAHQESVHGRTLDRDETAEMLRQVGAVQWLFDRFPKIHPEFLTVFVLAVEAHIRDDHERHWRQFRQLLSEKARESRWPADYADGLWDVAMSIWRASGLS
jgi:hypothetical protein